MIRGMVWLFALGIACAPGPQGTTAGNEAASAAAEALERARACADDLDRAGTSDVEAVARALPVEPVRIAPYRGTPLEGAAVRREVAARLDAARADAAAARSLASVAEVGSVRLAEERAIRAIRIADELCRAASSLPSERLARRRTGP
ncbi:MAG TPA: hypothetical protein VIV57_23815 [Anaeromyxobacter sp.]